MAGRQKILIVDDRRENLLLLEKVLAKTDAEVVPASGGNEALKLSLHQDFALAILDVQMPGMDGYELAEFLRGDKKNGHIPIIFLTAFQSDDYQIFKGYEAGGVDYLTKPYKPQILLAKVRIFLQLDRQKRELEGKLELERSKTYLESILTAMSDAVIVVNREGTIQKVNPAALKLIGTVAGGIIGKSIVPFFHNGETDAVSFVEWDRNFSATKLIPFNNREHTLLNARNERIPISLSLSLFNDETGEVAGAVFVANDIQEQKKEEENRIHLEKMRALGTMTAGMAHELNNPMTGILGFAEYCRKHTKPADKRHEVLGDIERETRRCIGIVQNLLTFSRREKSANEATEAIGLDVVLDRVLKLLSYRMEKEKVSVVRTGSHPCFPVNIHGEGIQQVFLNLIANALDALEGQGEKQIKITIGTDDGFVVVDIADNGTGISAHDLSRIFDPFYTTKPSGKGTGLGLSTSLGIVKAHGGDIRCSSQTRVGTTFSIRLPA